MGAFVECSTCLVEPHGPRGYIEVPSTVWPGQTQREPCPDCNGARRILATAARETLVNEIIGPEVGSKGAEAVLKALKEHRAELVDWLVEAEIVSRSRYGLVPWHPTSEWGKAGQTQWLPKEVGSDFTGTRLWRVNV